MKSAALLGIIFGCTGSQPRVFGQYNDLAPRVAPTQGERVPQHLTVQIARPANVAVFLVAPGRASRLLFPADSVQSSYVEAGSHLVETSLARATPADSSRLVRRPPEQTGGNRQPVNPRGGRGSMTGRDSLPVFAFNQHGYPLT